MTDRAAVKTKLWLASTEPLRDEALFRRLSEKLRPERREKLAALKNAGARRLSLGAGLLLDYALRAEGLQAAELRTTELGKPYFSTLPDFHFSLSHSGERVLCAASGLPVGCDIEAPQRFDPKLAERFFHPAESAWLLSLPAEEQQAAFFRLWTCKESFMKAIGLGFSLPMCDFAVSPDEPPMLTQRADPRPWRLRALREGEYYLALCGLDGAEDAPLRRVELNALGGEATA